MFVKAKKTMSQGADMIGNKRARGKIGVLGNPGVSCYQTLFRPVPSCKDRQGMGGLFHKPEALFQSGPSQADCPILNMMGISAHHFSYLQGWRFDVER
jgi:hypothetical protein